MKKNRHNLSTISDTKPTGAHGDVDEKAYDLSFIYRIQWSCPVAQIREAFRLLLLSPMTEPANVHAPLLPGHAGSADNSHMQETCRILACNPDTPPPVLEHLAQDGSADVLERVAENPCTAAGTLARLAWDQNASVRSSVAENQNTPEESFWLLAFDDSTDVRYMLAESAHVPEEILNRLTEDDNPYVALRAQRTVDRIYSSSALAQALSRVVNFVRRVLGKTATA